MIPAAKALPPHPPHTTDGAARLQRELGDSNKRIAVLQKQIAELVGLFNTAQKCSVSEFFRSIAEYDKLSYLHSDAQRGLKRWCA